VSLCFCTHPADVANLIDSHLAVAFYSSVSSSSKEAQPPFFSFPSYGTGILYFSISLLAAQEIRRL